MAAINETLSYRCYDNCRVDLFSTVVTTNESILPALNVSTVVRLSSLKFIFQNVVEYKTMDERQLITSLGGNLSLYLGASFLALHSYAGVLREAALRRCGSLQNERRGGSTVAAKDG